ncbi:hypothetical protein TIFTF001_022013 [Ficus carica]|uniref:Uncharacterized protein n=1 Tax=Ficus carica TaxID=3494 RepID=A0AA88DBA3_FICCA|nr:hypothetical protein TIFTF001_022013 [Ficus carica]
MVVELLVLSRVTEAVVSQTILRLSDLLIQEAKSLASIRDDVERFRNELRWMQCFLSSADGRQAESVNELVRNWVSEIRNVACDIEDVIEIFIVKMEQASYLTASFHLRTLRKQIYSIKARMRSIFDSRVNYNIRFDNTDQAAVAGPSAVELRRSYPDNEEEEEEEENGVTGLDDTKVALKNRLMEEQNELCAIPIVGTGGLGKTTLAKIVFNDSNVKQHFDCCAWVLISQQYVARDVFSEILMQIGYSQSRCTTTEDILEERRRERELLKTMEESELISLIRNNLRGRRYLVVLDDIWRVDTWNSIKRIFPRGNRGSKVVFTTRMMELALHADPRGIAIEPPLLTLEESWELLRRKAFPSNAFGERVCPLEFKNLGREMVRKFGGLPHAIVVLGGLLRTKISED